MTQRHGSDDSKASKRRLKAEREDSKAEKERVKGRKANSQWLVSKASKAGKHSLKPEPKSKKYPSNKVLQYSSDQMRTQVYKY